MLTGYLERSSLQGLVENLSSNWDALGVESSQLPNLEKDLYGANVGVSLSAEGLDKIMMDEIQKQLDTSSHLRDSPIFSKCTFLACKSMNFQGHSITPKRYHLGNSQISFKQFTPNSTLETGHVVSIAWEQSSKKYYFLVNSFIPLEDVDQEKDPYHNLGLLQAKMVYQAPGKMVVIHEGMIQGHIATLPYSVTQSGTTRDTLCVVALHYGVSTVFTINEIIT